MTTFQITIQPGDYTSYSFFQSRDIISGFANFKDVMLTKKGFKVSVLHEITLSVVDRDVAESLASSMCGTISEVAVSAPVHESAPASKRSRISAEDNDDFGSWVPTVGYVD